LEDGIQLISLNPIEEHLEEKNILFETCCSMLYEKY
jgi:hypothetical protein